jgi:hypothetical protein
MSEKTYVDYGVIVLSSGVLDEALGRLDGGQSGATADDEVLELVQQVAGPSVLLISYNDTDAACEKRQYVQWRESRA